MKLQPDKYVLCYETYMSNVTIAIDFVGPSETNIMTAINVECL